MTRKVLGKGIEAIIANKPTPVPVMATVVSETGLMELDIDAIYPNPYQPRKKFSADKIKDLADSMKEAGMIQPVVVYKDKEDNNKYYLMVGERRWRAAQFLKWSKIPAIVRDITHDDVVVGALVENIQREDLNAIEIGEAIELMIKELGLTHERAGERLAMSRSTLTNYLRLLKLPEAVKQSVISGTISQGHARGILALEDNTDILTALSKILKNNLSVRQTEAMVKNFHNQRNTEKIQKDPDVVRTEEKLSRKFSTKVKLYYSKKGSGKIEIYFNQVEEFDRVYKLLFNEKEDKE
ncbi:MAG TPA: ParB/RepB/Spo0J family partition protein [Candidatus Deferrimicrobium sp.]|nr:ParB/RepB/Spo0J family partition protein [Candidatus Deferrimicrobium sp.]